jgi:DNA-binding beta-propeller fold protein YncE
MAVKAVKLIALAVAALFLTVPLDAQKTKGKKKDTPPKPANLVWPLPPEQPRLRFLAAYRGEVDFDKKKESKFKALLLGPEDPKPMAVLVKPYGVAVDKAGVLYVTDTVQRKVFVIDPQARTVSFIGDTGQGRVVKPIGVALDEDGRVFVADASQNRIFGYDLDGNLIIAIGHEGELENPSGLTIDQQRKLLYVADSRKHVVMCYSSADGTFVRQVGKPGKEVGELSFPTNLSVDSQGRLYVADTMNFRVQVFDAEGAFLKAIGSMGDAVGDLSRPKGVGIDSEGHIYVADANLHRFQILDYEGRPLLVVGLPGSRPGEFLLPAGLFIDRQDRVYVADQGNARVQVFQYLKAPSTAQ